MKSRALLICIVYRLCASWLLAAIPARAVAQVLGHHPAGDAALWQPGGLWLAEMLRLGSRHVGVVGTLLSLIALVLAIGWLIPLGRLITALDPNRQPSPWRRQLQPTLQRFGSLVLLFGISMLLLSLCGLGTAKLVHAIVHAGWVHGRAADRFRLVILPLGTLLSWWLIGIAHDGMRLAFVQRDLGWIASLQLVADLLHRGGWLLLWAALWRASLSVAILCVSLAAGLGMTADGVPIAWVAAFMLVLSSLSWLLRADWLRWLSLRLNAIARLGCPYSTAPAPPQQSRS